MRPSLAAKWIDRFPVLLGGFALVFSVWGVSVGWNHGNLMGNEFRQTQTALSALFIQREDNFSLAYPTPVLGKPWAVPFEFPLYQWSVVILSNATETSLVSAARWISAACFFLTLPAVWILLKRMSVSNSGRWLVMAMVLTCPLHIFYARAFLIEMMALMFGVWFLLGYVSAMDRRSTAWLLVANVAGMGAGLVKVTTFMVYLLPALGWTVYRYFPDGREANRAARLTAWRRRTVWAAGAVALPFAASVWWVRFADAVKANSPVADVMVSSNLRQHNFGTWGMRGSPEIWADHWAIQTTNIVSMSALVATLALAVVARGAWQRWVVAAAALYALVPMVFPGLYAVHEYYWVATAVMLMTAMGLVLAGVWESTQISKVRGALAVVAVVGLQVGLYFQVLFPQQLSGGSGGDRVTQTLNLVSAPDDVLIVAGEDWSSMTPYYAQRRAMMIRRLTEADWNRIDPGLDSLAGETVGALVLRGEQRTNLGLLQRVGSRFGITTTPSIRFEDVDIYLNPARFEQLRAAANPIVAWGAKLDQGATGITEASVVDDGTIIPESLPDSLRQAFDVFSPQPVRFKAAYGISSSLEGSKVYFGSHPDVSLWFQIPPGKHRATVEVKLPDAAYREAGLAFADATDGVQVEWHEVPLGVTASGAGMSSATRLLFARRVNPRDVEADRGLVTIISEIELNPHCELELRITPGPNGYYNRDWASLGDVRIE